MKQLNNYRIYGDYDGQEIDVIVSAYSSRQAKFKAALNHGFHAPSFVKSSRIKVLKGGNY